MKVKEIVVEDVVAVASSIHVDEAAKLMNKKNIGCLLVVDGDETKGIVTQKDLIEKVLEKRRTPKQLKVADIMSRHLVVGDPESARGTKRINMVQANTEGAWTPPIH